MRRAKIVCTLGPATSTPERILELVEAGMDVARLNLSHGAYEDHEKVYAMVRQASDKVGKSVGVLVDLQGPKIRLGKLPHGPVDLGADDRLTITTRDVADTHDRLLVPTTYQGLPGDVNPGDQVLIDDGRVHLEVLEKNDTDVLTRVLVAGRISNHKGINLPGVPVSVPAMTDKDRADLRWALRQTVDLIALSFVRNAEDAAEVRAIMDEEGVWLPVVAKIEKPQAIDNLTEIIKAFDAFMVARGDLGVECPLEDVPFLQKRVIEAARRNAKPVIVATQMLESMITAPRPTRAEASDVANAVLDGADAVMLSGETSVGEYPIETVRTMARIVESTEDHELEHMAAIDWQPRTRGGVIAKAAVEVAERVGAKYLVAFTQSGDSARRLSRLRSAIPILAFTPVPVVRSQLSLSWGIETFIGESVDHTDEMVRQVDESLLRIGRVKEGDLVVIIAGSPPGIPGSTNALRIHRMGDAINEVAPAYRRTRS
ncbi:pyruvate kinase [Nocardioides marmoribigeumensis]|uniref:Pyruvate kinase n=1 Tax=Nocardioides marmoribigeumensis TaxID=433649 RepID=A0ABU2BRH7_9ACTN|nr:pyruvate kinase [Nocardioides marmoribigeumensis]MDR7361230.1 pyruvate kinase [Nocardioides marmoribigeumensis]